MSACARPANRPVDVTAVRQADAQLNDLARQIMGNVQQRSAAAHLIYEASTLHIASCLAAEGVTYYPPGFQDFYQSMTDADLGYGFEDDGWLAPISTTRLGTTSARVFVMISAVPPPITATSIGEQATYHSQVTACTKPPSAYSAMGVPKDSAHLLGQLDDTVRGVLSSAPIKALTTGYASCMAWHGQGPVATPAALLARTTDSYRYAATSAWKTITAITAKAPAADARCRSGIVNQALMVLGPKLTGFSAQHAAQLAQIRDEWAAIAATTS